MISLETDRLILRSFTPDDWQGLQEAVVAYQASDSAQYEDPWPTSDEKIQEIASWFAGGDDYLAVCLQDPGTLIGLVAIGRRSDQERAIYNGSWFNFMKIRGWVKVIALQMGQQA